MGKDSVYFSTVYVTTPVLAGIVKVYYRERFVTRRIGGRVVRQKIREIVKKETKEIDFRKHKSKSTLGRRKIVTRELPDVLRSLREIKKRDSREKVIV